MLINQIGIFISEKNNNLIIPYVYLFSLFTSTFLYLLFYFYLGLISFYFSLSLSLSLNLNLSLSPLSLSISLSLPVSLSSFCFPYSHCSYQFTRGRAQYFLRYRFFRGKYDTSPSIFCENDKSKKKSFFCQKVFDLIDFFITLIFLFIIVQYRIFWKINIGRSAIF